VKRYICIHGHFYQPPRENPWLEAVEVEDSAEPFHDWNARIHQECYRANAAARVLDAKGRIQAIRDNYRRLSFNFGPTLLSWMEREAPDDLARLVRADAASAARFGGHGGAMAQAYNHQILPLANQRDKRTQVRWGLADFRHRFGRDAEGLWLPETAVDLDSLEALAEFEVKFTVLAPHQALRVRSGPHGEWQEVSEGSIDTTRAYRQTLPSGRSIDLFFYDGALARGVAFEGLLDDGKRFADRLKGALPAAPSEACLVHIATDGESYGHHHRFGDMALATAIQQLENDDSLELITYGAFLEQHPPTWEVEIRENSSWSCAHGIERWRSDCGCSTGGVPEFNQSWRAPLREALNWLRDELSSRFEEKAGALLVDPFDARDAWIGVMLDRSPENLERFFKEHQKDRLSDAQRSDVACLMELQRHALLMFTSCGWFFDDPSGLETRQILRYANRALQLAEEVLGPTLEPAFLSRLQGGHSNDPEVGSLASIYQDDVGPSRVGLADVAAHWAVSSFFRGDFAKAEVFRYTLDPSSCERVKLGDAGLGTGQVEVHSSITLRRRKLDFAIVHFGDHNLAAAVAAHRDLDEFQEFAREAKEQFGRGDLPGVVRLLDDKLGSCVHSLSSLFRDERRRVLGKVLEGPLREAEESLGRLYRSHEGLLRYLRALEVPLPTPLRASARWVLETSLARALASEPVEVDTAEALAETLDALDLVPDADALAASARRGLRHCLRATQSHPNSAFAVDNLVSFLALCERYGISPEIFEAQNIVAAMMNRIGPSMAKDRTESGLKWQIAHEKLCVALGLNPSLEPPFETEAR